MTKEFALAVSQDETFAQSETDFITKNFVCAICHADLQVVFMPNEARVLIVCIEHGNVCYTGRVTHATVSIEMERSFRRFHEVIRNLPEFWGELIDKSFPRHEADQITRHCVCAVCGGKLYQYMESEDPNKVQIKCTQHGNINDCHYVEKSKFVYDFNKMRAYEKTQRNKLITVT